MNSRQEQRLFILNPSAAAGRAPAAWQALQPELRRRGLDGELVVTTRPGEALEVAAAAAERYPVIVAVGGDGTAHEVASGLAGSEHRRATLGIIPCGTGNDLAMNLGIASPAAAIATLEAGSRRAIDTIEVVCRGGTGTVERRALLFAAAGIIGPQLRYTTALAKRVLGRSLAYRFASIRALLVYRAPRLRLSCDGQALESSFLYIGAHNAETFGGGMRIAPGAKLDDGLMRINLIGSIGRGEALRQFRKLCRGEHTSHPGVRYFTATRLEIQSAASIDVAVDGDLVGFTPAQFRICPRSLSVLTPG